MVGLYAERVSNRLRTLSLALAVGLVLADSSIVILALPDLLSAFDVEVGSLHWPITVFNAVLALAAVPAAFRAARRYGAGLVCERPGAVRRGVAGLRRLAGPLGARRRAGRAGGRRGRGGVRVALELLTLTTGSERRRCAFLTAAGVAGAAVGPALGGFLTQAFSWQAIFLVQAPLAALAILGTVRGIRRERAVAAPADRRTSPPWRRWRSSRRRSRRRCSCFVLLLVEGWRLEPSRPPSRSR